MPSIAAGEDLDHADGDDRCGEHASDPRRPVRRSGEVATPRPERRPQHPAAVERQRRHEVEDEQHEVDVARATRARWRSAPGARPQPPPRRTKSTPRTRLTSGPATAIRNSAPADGNSPAILATPAEEPQGDPLDLHCPRAGPGSRAPARAGRAQAKKTAVAVTPMAAYVPQLRPGRTSGNWTAESDQRIRPKHDCPRPVQADLDAGHAPEHDGRREDAARSPGPAAGVPAAPGRSVDRMCARGHGSLKDGRHPRLGHPGIRGS